MFTQYIKINLLSFFENKDSPIICYKYNKPICTSVLTTAQLSN